jgi:beta propeller repeat protein
MINDGNDWEITLSHNAQKEMEQITDNFTNDRYPRISGDNIVWMSGQGGDSEIYLASHGTVVPPDLEDDGNNLARLIRDRIQRVFSVFVRTVGMTR